jgi:ferredoxin/flavodoxin---NADP+ reductase
MADYFVTELGGDIDFDVLPYWDVVIVGAGPAGLAASLTTAHRGLTTLIVEAKEHAGGQPWFLYPHKRIVDVPGFPEGVTGEELSDRVYRQACAARVQFRFGEELVSIEDTDEVANEDSVKRVVTSRSQYRCRKVILAFGLLHYPRHLPILDALESRNVHYKIPRIGDYEGGDVAVVGGGDSALDAAAMVLERNGRPHVIARSEVLRARADMMARVTAGGGVIHAGTEIATAGFENDRIALTLTDGGERLVCDVVIVQIGFLSAHETFQRLDLRMNDDGSVAIDPYYETSRRGIFAVGDVHGDIKLIAVAWAEGIQAAIYAFREITSPYWLSERRLHDLKLTLISEKIHEAADMQSGRRPAR